MVRRGGIEILLILVYGDQMDDLNSLDFALKKSKRGGKRPGAGRKPFIDRLTVEEQKKIKDVLEAKVWIDAAEKIAWPAIIDLASNEDVQDKVRFMAAQEIMNRALGKPKERHELGGVNGEPIFIKWQ